MAAIKILIFLIFIFTDTNSAMAGDVYYRINGKTSLSEQAFNTECKEDVLPCKLDLGFVENDGKKRPVMAIFGVRQDHVRIWFLIDGNRQLSIREHGLISAGASLDDYGYASKTTTIYETPRGYYEDDLDQGRISRAIVMPANTPLMHVDIEFTVIER